MQKIIPTSVVLVALSVPAGAEAKRPYPLPTDRAKDVYSGLYHAVRDEHGKRAPGRNIRRWGVLGRDRKMRRASAREIAESTRQLRLLRRPLLEGRLPPQRPGGVLTAKAPAGGTLEAIAACESGGNYRAVDPSGTYTGAYQFDDQTWRSVGGTGRAGDASLSEQDQRAARLHAERGAAPWPVCGR